MRQKVEGALIARRHRGGEMARSTGRTLMWVILLGKR